MIKAVETLKKLSTRMKRFLGGDKAVQMEAGYINEDFSLTEKAKDSLLEKLADTEEYNAYLTELAKEDIAEAEKEAEKCSR